MKSDHFTVADMTPQFCTSQCSAVVGGVLVFYDSHHMTDTFAKTLVPFLRKPVTDALDRAVADRRGI